VVITVGVMCTAGGQTTWPMTVKHIEERDKKSHLESGDTNGMSKNDDWKNWGSQINLNNLRLLNKMNQPNTFVSIF